MKLKDIEKNLKRENESKAVPEVYSRVSKAPLNKLLEGETPARAFRKQAVMNMLLIVLALLFVAAIGLSAMWLAPRDNASVPDCYASVTVLNADGETRIGIVLSGGKNILAYVTEITDGIYNSNPTVSHSSRISDFISPKSGDKVRISLLSNVSATLVEAARFIASEIETAYGRVEFEMTTTANQQDTRDSVSYFITRCGGRTEAGATLSELILAYAELFA